uniref:GpW protein n=1 Tax=Candidatus Kentrum sp. FW TaxID=2126338 RepID=A0A450U1X4_9GAMM|nr:MAG: gpW protein [Candidatus Kentron sp. FW]
MRGRDVLHQLVTGAQTVGVDVEGQRVGYAQMRRGDLQRYIRHPEAAIINAMIF